MHLHELLACFALMLCFLSYSFVVSIENLDLDSEYKLCMVIHLGPLSSWGYGRAPF